MCFPSVSCTSIASMSCYWHLPCTQVHHGISPKTPTLSRRLHTRDCLGRYLTHNSPCHSRFVVWGRSCPVPFGWTFTHRILTTKLWSATVSLEHAGCSRLCQTFFNRSHLRHLASSRLTSPYHVPRPTKPDSLGDPMGKASAYHDLWNSYSVERAL